MGGGVGVGCHGSHRIVDGGSRIAMPECSIGLIPDVGGSLLLARAPGRMGEYLGTTAARMDAGDAIHCGFADYFIAPGQWDSVKTALIETGDAGAVDSAAVTPPDGPLMAMQEAIDRSFAGEELRDILTALEHIGDNETIAKIAQNSPLSTVCAIELIHRVRARDDIRYALSQEFRFTARAAEHGDFLEGIRAAIIDRDRAPAWKHAGPRTVSGAEMSAMLMPLGADNLSFLEG